MGFFSQKCLGIDIGSSSVKVVELSSGGKKKKLENYAEFKLPLTSDSTPLKTFQGDNFLPVCNDVALILQTLLKRAKIKEKKAVFSIPDFSTFFTTFSLPPMSEAEIPQAVQFEARHHIPLPLSEVTFDWQIVDKEETVAGAKTKVLLVAVPNVVLQSYQRLAEMAQIKIKGIEAEIFGLIRSFNPPSRLQGAPICLVDIGWRSTTVSVAESGNLKASFSFDFSASSLAEAISKELNIGLEEAREIQERFGLDPKKEKVFKTMINQMDVLAMEVEKICQIYERDNFKGVENIYLAGGASEIFGFKEYLTDRIKKQVFFVSPFTSVSFPDALEKKIKKMSSSFAVCVGSALLGVNS